MNENPTKDMTNNKTFTRVHHNGHRTVTQSTDASRVSCGKLRVFSELGMSKNVIPNSMKQQIVQKSVVFRTCSKQAMSIFRPGGLDIVLPDVVEIFFDLFPKVFEQKRVLAKTTCSPRDPPKDLPKCQEQPGATLHRHVPKIGTCSKNWTPNPQIYFATKTSNPPQHPVEQVASRLWHSLELKRKT